MGTLLMLREAQKPLPAAAVLVSPWVDLRMTTDAYKQFARWASLVVRWFSTPNRH